MSRTISKLANSIFEALSSVPDFQSRPKKGELYIGNDLCVIRVNGPLANDLKVEGVAPLPDVKQEELGKLFGVAVRGKDITCSDYCFVYGEHLARIFEDGRETLLVPQAVVQAVEAFLDDAKADAVVRRVPGTLAVMFTSEHVSVMVSALRPDETVPAYRGNVHIPETLFGYEFKFVFDGEEIIGGVTELDVSCSGKDFLDVLRRLSQLGEADVAARTDKGTEPPVPLLLR